jgi:hypothetical protein
MRLSQLAAGLLIAGLAIVSSAQAATRIDDPKAYITSVYATLAKGAEYDAPADVFSPRLSALIAQDVKEANGDEGRMDIDYWTNAQDWKVTDVHVTSQPVAGAPGRQTIIAKFKNFGGPVEIHFYFLKTAAGWKLDDIASPISSAQSPSWTYSLVLQYGF